MLLPELGLPKNQQVEPTKPVQKTEQIDPEKAMWQLTVLRIMGLTNKFVARSGDHLYKPPGDELAAHRQHTRRKDFHISGHHNTDTRGRSDERLGSLRLKQATADEASLQEIKEYEVSLTDPIQEQDQNAKPKHVEIFTSRLRRAKGISLSLRSFAPDESAGPKLTKSEEKALRKERIGLQRLEREAHRQRGFGKFNTGLR